MMRRTCIMFLLCGHALVAGEPPPESARIPDGASLHWFGLKYMAATLEFRDAAGERWPHVFYVGKNASLGGRFVMGRPQAQCSMMLADMRLIQGEGDQSLKTLGELIDDPAARPALRLAVESIGPWRQRPPSDAMGAPEPCGAADLAARLTLGTRTIPLRGEGRFSYAFGPGSGLATMGTLQGPRVRLRALFPVSGAELGLRSVPQVVITLTASAYDAADIGRDNKGRSLTELGIPE